MKMIQLRVWAFLVAMSVAAEVAVAQQPSSLQGAPGYFAQVGDGATGSAVIPAAVNCSGPNCQAVGGGTPLGGFSEPVGCDSGGMWASGCDDVVTTECFGDCAAGCNGCCDAWAHFTSIYGGLLYLRPRNADVAYGVPIDGPLDSSSNGGPIQVGPVGSSTRTMRPVSKWGPTWRSTR